jgi:hypothetical protein
MSDEVLVALNSNLGTAAPSSHSPRDDVEKVGNSPSRGQAWAFSVAIDLPAAAGSADGRADSIDRAKQAITQFLTPVEENGSLCIVKSIVARFNSETLLQQNQPLHTVLRWLQEHAVPACLGIRQETKIQNIDPEIDILNFTENGDFTENGFQNIPKPGIKPSFDEAGSLQEDATPA